MYSNRQMCLITAILPMATVMPIVRELHSMGIFTANKSTARGSSNTSKIHDVEMEIMTVLIDEERSDEIFELIYDRGDYLRERRELMQWWANECDKMRQGAQVITLRA